MYYDKFITPDKDYITIQHEIVNEIGLVGAYLLSSFQYSYRNRNFKSPIGIIVSMTADHLKVPRIEILNGCKKIADLNVGSFEGLSPLSDVIYFQPNLNLFSYNNNIKRVMKPVRVLKYLIKKYGLKYAYFYGLLWNATEIQCKLKHPETILHKYFVEITDRVKNYFKDFNLMKMLDFFKNKGLVDYIEFPGTKNLGFQLNFYCLWWKMIAKSSLNKIK